MKMPKKPVVKPLLFIFDLDGTLIDSRVDLAAAVNRVRRHYGLAPLTVATVAGYVGEGIRVLMQRAIEGTGIDLDGAVRLQQQFYGENPVDATTLYPGVAAGLARLRTAGHRLAVISNKPAALAVRILAHFKLRDSMIYVAGDGPDVKLKPEPDMVLDAMRAAGLAAAQTWVVGDHFTDLEAARRAGVHSIFMTYGFGRSGKEKPERTYASFEEFVRAFAK